ncbi:MAG: hypothetical protein PHV82_11060 [Victivallaceae bacterium]|nr:hypothetical protein [Victivallaceae bacterium]
MDKTAKKNKIILITGISMTCLALTATVVSALIPRKAPDPKELGPTKKVTYMASKEFARLPEKEKMKYMSQLGHPRQAFRTLSEKERQAVFKNTGRIMQKRMQEHITKFFKMSREEQNRELDRMIAEGEKRRQEMEARRAANSSNNGSNRQGPPRGNFRAMMQGMLENTDSTTRAQMSEFFRRMRERRTQTQGK